MVRSPSPSSLPGLLGPLPPLLPTPEECFPNRAEIHAVPKRLTPSKLRRNSRRLLEYNTKKASELAISVAKHQARTLIRKREEEMQLGLKKLTIEHKARYDALKEKLYTQIRVLQKRVADKDSQFADLHLRTLAPLAELKAARELAKEYKSKLWILQRGRRGLQNLLSKLGFRASHSVRATESINQNESYYVQNCTYVSSNGRYSCDCGREDSVNMSFFNKLAGLCRDGKHEKAEELIFGDVLTKKTGGKKEKKSAGSAGPSVHDCAKCIFCTEDYCSAE